MYLIVFFFVIFTLFFPLLLKEGYVYDPLSLFTKWPGYRLSHTPGLREATGAASDLYDAFLPHWTYNYRSIKEGTFPLWRFNKGLGVPIYEQPYHPEMLISFFVAPAEALTLRILLKLFLGMIGMFLLLRSLQINNTSCIIGGIAYALSGFMIGWLHGLPSSTAYHIPFLFLFLVEFLKSKEVKFLFYFALWTSLMIYSGFHSITGYSFYAVGLFLIIFYLFDKQKLYRRIKEVLKILLYWILGIITMSFSFILLYYSLFISKSLDISYRQIGRVNFISPKYLINIIFPFYHGWEITPEIRPYVSSIITLFVVLGLIFLTYRLIKFKGSVIGGEKYYISFFLILIPFLMAMFGFSPFYQISCRLPVLKSSPLNRLQSITSFILVILGVIGLELFIRSYSKISNFFKERKYRFLGVVEILFISSTVVAITSLLSDEKTHYHSIYPVFILLSSVILVFQITVFLRKKAVFFLIILVPLVATDTIIQSRRYVPVNKKIHFITEMNVPLIDFVKKNLRKHEGVLVFDSNYNINGTLGNYGVREMIVHEFYHPDYKALILDTFSEESFVTPTAPALDSNYTDFSSSFIQLMGVKHLIFPFEYIGENLPSYYHLVYNRLDGKIYENRLYNRSKGIFFCRPVYYNPEGKSKVIKKVKTMDYSKHVYIEKGKKIDLDYQDEMSCSVDVIEYTPNRIRYKYRATSDGVLTFPEAFDDGWSVTVNGRKTDVLRTNLVFRGVALKKGKGEIVFTYHISRVFKILVLFGLLSLLLLVSLYLFSVKFKKKQRGKVDIS